MKHDYAALPIPYVTPTSLNDLICTKRFWTLRVPKRWPPRSPLSFGAFGTAVHAILSTVFDPRNAPLPNLDNLDVWAREAFFRSCYADREAREHDMNRAKRMVIGYCEQIDIEEAQATIAAERLMEVPIFHAGKPLFVMSGVADRLFADPDDSTMVSI